MNNSTLAYCQVVDRRYEADTNAESECPFCRALAAEKRIEELEREAEAEHARLLETARREADRAAQAEQRLDLANEHAKRLMDERDELLRKLEQAQQLIEELYTAWWDAPLEMSKRSDRIDAMTKAAALHYEAQA